jgi:hypothetical protein
MAQAAFVSLRPSWSMNNKEPLLLSSYLPHLLISRPPVFTQGLKLSVPAQAPTPTSAPVAPTTEAARQKQDVFSRIAASAVRGNACISKARGRLSETCVKTFATSLLQAVQACRNETHDLIVWCDAQDRPASEKKEDGVASTHARQLGHWRMLPWENAHCAAETALRNLEKRVQQLCDEVARYTS